jgi:hypothetical protein
MAEMEHAMAKIIGASKSLLNINRHFNIAHKHASLQWQGGPGLEGGVFDYTEITMGRAMMVSRLAVIRRPAVLQSPLVKAL